MHPTLSHHCKEELAFFVFLSWLVGQLEFEIHILFSDLKRKQWEPSESFAYYCAYFLTTITLDISS